MLKSKRLEHLENLRDQYLIMLEKNTAASPEIFGKIHMQLSHVLLKLHTIKQRLDGTPADLAKKYETHIYEFKTH